MKNHISKLNKVSRVAVITGGVRRLGRYISYHLADSGYNLAIIYYSSSRSEIIRTTKYLASKKIKYKFYRCDLRNSSLLEKTIDKIGKDLGKIDLLINNAGIITRIDFEKISTRLFDDTIAVNLRAPLLMSQFSLKLLAEANDPLIINIASLGGLQNWPNHIPYSISKAALIKLTTLLAGRLAPKIRVNAIAPGAIVIEDEEAGTPEKAPVEKIPLKRYGNPDDIIHAIDFLIKSTYVTGQVIAVDGGRTVSN